MPHDSLNQLQRNLVRIAAEEGAEFEAHYGKTARYFLDRMPVLFPLMRRAALDLTLPTEVRRIAAVCVLYVAEPDDFMGATQFGVRSLLDDSCLLFMGFARCRTLVADASLARHVRVDGVYEELCALTENHTTLKALLPPKVAEQLDRLLAGADADDLAHDEDDQADTSGRPSASPSSARDTPATT